MHRRTVRRSKLAALVVLVALVLAACGSSNDPTTWEEADEGNVRENFVLACTDANAENGRFDDTTLTDYCTCSYDEVRQAFDGDYEGFRDLEDELRNDPEAVPANVAALFEGCAASATSS